MKKNILILLAAVLALWAFQTTASAQQAQPKKAETKLSDFAPEDAMLYIEVSEFKSKVEAFRGGEFLREFEAFLAETGKQERNLSGRIDELVKNRFFELLSGGFSLSLTSSENPDAKPDFTLVAKSGKEAAKLINQIMQTEKTNGKFDDIAEETYKDTRIFRAVPRDKVDYNAVFFMTSGDLAFVSSSKVVLTAIVDSGFAGVAKPLSAVSKFKEVADRRSTGRLALLYVDGARAAGQLRLAEKLEAAKDDETAPIRKLLLNMLGKEVENLDHMFAEMIVPLPDEGEKADSIGVMLSFVSKDDAMPVQPALPAQPAAGPEFAKFVGPDAIGVGFTKTDLAGLWNQLKDLAGEKLKSALGSWQDRLTQVFGGMDFEKEVLPFVARETGFVITKHAAKQKESEVSFPAATFFVQIKEDEKNSGIARSIKSIIGIGMLVLTQKSDKGIEIVTKEIAEQKMTTVVFRGTVFGEFVKPTYLFYKDFMIISTLPEAVEQAVGVYNSGSGGIVQFPELATQGLSSAVAVDLGPMVEFVSANKAMLVKAKLADAPEIGEEKAARQVDMLIKLAGHFQRLSLTYSSSRAEKVRSAFVNVFVKVK